MSGKNSVKYEFIDNESEEPEKESEKKGSKYDIKKKTQEAIASKFVKKKSEPRVCVFRFETKFSPAPKTDSNCYLCPKPGKYKIGFPLKPGMNKTLLERFVCNVHKKDFLSCSCEELPLSVAICNYLPTEKWCPCFNIQITSAKLDFASLRNQNEHCSSEFQFEFSELTEPALCSICGNPAIVKAKNYKKSDFAFNETLFFCEKHKFPLGCSRSEVLCESAPCQFLDKKSDCIFFNSV